MMCRPAVDGKVVKSDNNFGRNHVVLDHFRKGRVV
jgi:hypothetical protein